MPTLIENALARLRKRVVDEPWKPGLVPSDDEVIYNYILKLQQDLRLAHDREYVNSWATNPDRMGGQFTDQEIKEARRGGHGW